MSGARVCRFGWVLWLAGRALAQEAPAERPAAPAAGPPPAGVERAAALLRAGRADEARELLLALVAAAPRHGGARMLLGRIELERGDPDAARRHLEIAVTASPPRPFAAWHLLGRTRLAGGEPGPAVEAWNRSLELAPRFTPALVGRARATLRLGGVEPASGDLERALGLAASDPEAALLLAEIRLLEDRPGEAVELLARVTASPEAAPPERLAAELLTLAASPATDLAALRAAVGRDPQLARGLLALALAELAAGTPAAARNALRAALATDDGDPVPWLLLRRRADGGPPLAYPPPFPTLPRLLASARQASAAADAQAAALAEILARRPHHLAARLLFAAAAERRDDPAGDHLFEALETYLDLLERHPGVPAIQAAAARTARAMGALDLAGCLAKRAAGALPRDAAAHYLLAAVQTDAGRYDEAVASCRRALELGLEEAPVYVTLGFAELERMNIAESIAAYSRALALDPRSFGGIPRFALAALGSEEIEALEALLGARLAADPDDREALYGLGTMRLNASELARARELFSRLAALSPDDPQVHYNLATIHFRSGDRRLGDEAMERFRRLEAIEAERWLEHNRAHARRLEARAAVAAGEPATAVEIYRALAAAGTADREDYLAAGQACLVLGDFQRAHGWFAELVAADPYHREALRGLAAAAAGLGRSDESRRAREKAELLDRDCDRRAG